MLTKDFTNVCLVKKREVNTSSEEAENKGGTCNEGGGGVGAT